ncbi:MAG: thiamine pyrophosphate-binding protein [Rhodospirillales bacterium]
MASNLEPRLGGHILADQLVIQGADTAFCVPGESYLTLLDGLYHHQNSIRVVHSRHEGAAANMADAYGKMTGKPGICMVTRGPGATNASIGVHTAFQDSTPMIVLIGQIGRSMTDREAFQEIDYRRMFGEMAKWVAQIDQVERIPEYISRAFHVSQSGRPGPVVLALPEDMLSSMVTVADAKKSYPVEAAPTPEAMEELRDRLSKAKKPLLIVGGPTWNKQAVEDVTAFVEANNLPVACAFRYQDRFNNTHPNYVGDIGIGINPKLATRVKESDLLIIAGPRMGEMTTGGYSMLNIPETDQDLIHIMPGAEELGRVYNPDLGINSSLRQFCKMARELAPVDNSAWASEAAIGNADYLERIKPTDVPGDVNMSEIVSWLSNRMPEDGVVTHGAGNYSVWVTRFFQHRTYPTQIAPTNGAMGYSVPAAIGAKITDPNRMVVSFNGDGCFMMLGQEMITAKQFNAPVIFIVVNNGMLGTIRMHQEREFPNNVMSTELMNPDFVQLAESYGAQGERVTRTEDFEAAFERAVNCGRSALIELVVDEQALTPAQTLDQVRAAGSVKKK